MIPFHDLKRQYNQIQSEINTAITGVCEQTAFAGGSFVEMFENNLAEYCNSKFAIGVNSGTSALHLINIVLGIKSGDEVILPANTFIATAWGVSYVNATPVFVDCDSKTWNIDPKKIEDKITSRTKAIIGVHLYGQPCDIDSIKEIARKNKLFFIEDNAQSIGATYKGLKTGSLSDLSSTSFYPGKNLGAYGESGGITTNNKEYSEHLKMLRNHGSNKRYFHEEIGFNMRMDGIQASILNLKLKYLDTWNNRRKEIAKKYQTGIINKKITMQFQPEWSDSVYHLFVITIPDRTEFMKYMSENGVQTALHYPVPCHLQNAYSSLGYKKGDCPNSEHLAENCVSLPMFPEMTDKEVDIVIDRANSF